MADKAPKSAIWVRHPNWTFSLVAPGLAALLAWSVVHFTGPAWAIPPQPGQVTQAANTPSTPPPAPPAPTPAPPRADQPNTRGITALATEQRLAELERRQEALVDRVIEGRSKTIDWWLAYLAVFTGVLALGGVLLPFVMGRREREQIKADQSVVERDRDEVRRMKDEIELHLRGTKQNLDESNRLLAAQRPEPRSGGGTQAISEEVAKAASEVKAAENVSPIDRLRAEAMAVPGDNPEKAYSLWNALLALNPRDAQATFYCGYWAQDISENETRQDQSWWRKRASEHYRSAVELDRQDHTAFYNWGTALDAEARALATQDLPAARALWQQAGQCYAEALRIKPDVQEAIYNWGDALDAEARALAAQDLPAARALWQQSGQHYAEALHLKPDDHEAASNWGAALDVEARALAAQDLPAARTLWQQASQRYAEALRIKPDVYEAVCNWGTALAAEADALATQDLPAARTLWQQAGQRYAEALRIKPDVYEAVWNWGTALAAEAGALAAQDLPAARALWQQAGQRYAEALRIKPDLHAAANAWGEALDAEACTLTAQDLPAARALWQQAGQRYAEALRIKPNDHEAVSNWGNALLHEAAAVADSAEVERLSEQARMLLEGAAKAEPDLAAYDLACAYARLKNFEASLAWLRRSRDAGGLPDRNHLETDPDLAELRQQAAFAEFLEETYDHQRSQGII